MLDVARTHSKTVHGQTFHFAEVRGYGDADHASVWTFDDEQQFRDRWFHPAKGETVLDIGAAFGSYALPALARGARVVCFSPADFDTELLEKNLSLNPELERRCLVVRDGVYSNDGWFQPDRCAFRDVDGQGAPMLKSDEPGWLWVRSLDSFLDERPGISRIDWIKLDIEGAELEALKGAEKCLRMYRPKVLVENHEQHVPGIENAVRDYLVGLGLGYVCDGPYQYGVVSHSFFVAQ
jgi:FkbM family methyltransferase